MMQQPGQSLESKSETPYKHSHICSDQTKLSSVYLNAECTNSEIDVVVSVNPDLLVLELDVVTQTIANETRWTCLSPLQGFYLPSCA